MVRAYKTTKESESSNEVKIKPKKETRTLKNYGFLSFAGPLWKQWSFWTIVALLLAVVSLIIWYLVDRAKRKKAEGKIETLNSKP